MATGLYWRRNCVRSTLRHEEGALRQAVYAGSMPPVIFAPSARHAPLALAQRSSAPDVQAMHRSALTTTHR
jgi:hypothetical protein